MLRGESDSQPGGSFGDGGRTDGRDKDAVATQRSGDGDGLGVAADQEWDDGPGRNGRVRGQGGQAGRQGGAEGAESEASLLAFRAVDDREGGGGRRGDGRGQRSGEDEGAGTVQKVGAQKLVAGLYPILTVDQSVVDAADAVLAETDEKIMPPALRRLLLEQRDGTLRLLRGQAVDANA